jgi:hypothetical protein
MRVSVAIVVSLVLAVSAFAYCREYSMDLIIGPDGGGYFFIEYESTDPDYCDENTCGDIENEYDGSGCNVENCEVDEPEVGVIVVSYKLNFDDIEDTDDYGVFGFFPDIDYTITLTEGTDYVYQNSIYTDVRNYDVYRNYKYNYTVVCPSNVVSTNGQISASNPKVVRWSYTFYELVENGTTNLNVTYVNQ